VGEKETLYTIGVNEISPAMMEIIMVAPQEWKSRITI
jgi:hypothetical protein